uniref:Uncharacterized protein n=1 Tax=Arundo donax TaxID=35708 RepID=A0A0A8YRU5_ARUDO
MYMGIYFLIGCDMAMMLVFFK